MIDYKDARAWGKAAGHIRPEDDPERFAHFAPGCIVFHRNTRCVFVYFEKFGAIIQRGTDLTVVWADELEYLSPPTADTATFARERTPPRRLSWDDQSPLARKRGALLQELDRAIAFIDTMEGRKR